MNPVRIGIYSDIGGLVTVDGIRSQLGMADQSAPLLVEINSEGGSVSEAVAIYNLLRSWRGDVTVEIVGWALSAATIVAMAGTTIRMHSSSLLMLHAPWLSSTSGNADALRQRADMLDQVAESMRVAYGRTNQPASVIANWLAGEDHWFTAEDALAVGLVDEIIPARAAAAVEKLALASCRYPVPSHLIQRVSAMSTSPSPLTPAQNIDQIRAEAVRAEGARRGAIRAMFSRHLYAPGVAGLLTACEEDPNCSDALAGQRLLAALGSGMSPVVGSHGLPDTFSSASGGHARGDDRRLGEFRAAAVDVLLQRAGIKVADPHPAARDLQRLNIVAMAERVLSMHGQSTTSLSKGEIVKAAMTTSDFPALLSALTGKALRAGYENTSATHVGWTGEREVADFKMQTLAMLSEAPSLDLVPESGEYKFGAFAESAETFTVKTYGKIVRFSRQALINDDLGALTTIPNAQGAAARRLESDQVYGKLTGNAVMADGVTLFHASHGNLAPAGAALSVDSLGAARAAMRQQKGINGLDFLDPQPRYLIVPVSIETKAETLLNSTVDPARSNNTENSEWIRKLTLVADPRLDSVSPAAWYLSTDPRQIEGIVRAYLTGEPRPFLDDQEGWVTDTTDYKVRLDFGVGVIDYRGLYKNPGAA